MVIRRVNPVSAAKIGGVLYALLGLLIGGIISLMAMAFGGAIAAATDQANGAPMFGMLFGAGAIIIMPICYGIIGFIGTLISAALYNIAAKFTGGVEIEAA